jgi:SNF2 family DNA or RNA helicase
MIDLCLLLSLFYGYFALIIYFGTDILESTFSKSNIPFFRFDGKLSLKERVKVLRDFETTSSQSNRVGSVLLLSMKCGGVGLNLVAARSCFIADPWWNAALEDQCVDRIHRIGQTADKVRIRKFFVADSVEERIMELQKRKKSVATKVLCDTNSSLKDSPTGRPTLDDFKVLFQNARFD